MPFIPFTVAEYEAHLGPRDTGNNKKAKSNFIDPWINICQRCALPDCIRLEGALENISQSDTRRYATRGCAVAIAQLRRWTPDRALQEAGELGLLPERPRDGHQGEAA